ncbi:hypothetical protein Tco_0425695 [Tanacetum coccineum]
MALIPPAGLFLAAPRQGGGALGLVGKSMKGLVVMVCEWEKRSRVVMKTMEIVVDAGWVKIYKRLATSESDHDSRFQGRQELSAPPPPPRQSLTSSYHIISIIWQRWSISASHILLNVHLIILLHFLCIRLRLSNDSHLSACSALEHNLCEYGGACLAPPGQADNLEEGGDPMSDRSSNGLGNLRVCNP